MYSMNRQSKHLNPSLTGSTNVLSWIPSFFLAVTKNTHTHESARKCNKRKKNESQVSKWSVCGFFPDCTAVDGLSLGICLGIFTSAPKLPNIVGMELLKSGARNTGKEGTHPYRIAICVDNGNWAYCAIYIYIRHVSANGHICQMLDISIYAICMWSYIAICQSRQMWPYTDTSHISLYAQLLIRPSLNEKGCIWHVYMAIRPICDRDIYGNSCIGLAISGSTTSWASMATYGQMPYIAQYA